MALPLTVEMVAHAYEYLCCTAPFNKWNLPASEDIKFSIIRKKDRYAHYQLVRGVHHIALSSRFVGRHESLLSTLCHEMIHLHMASVCAEERDDHGPTFSKYADRVCKIHEFDRLIF